VQSCPPLADNVNAIFANRGFKFEKRRQLFIRAYNEPLSIAAMRVGNPDGSPLGIEASCVSGKASATSVVQPAWSNPF